MVSRILYTQANFRKPIRAVPLPGLQDTQSDIPAGWCRRCGGECYRPGNGLCGRCQRLKGEREYEHEVLQLPQPLPALRAGTGSGEM